MAIYTIYFKVSNFNHNAFCGDLIKYSWPPTYEQTGQTMHLVYLNTYVGHYLRFLER